MGGHFSKMRNEQYHQLACSLSGALSYFCIGLVRSWASTSVPSLNNVNVTNGGTGVSHPVSDAPLNPETLSWMTAFPPLLAIFGSVLSSVLLDKLGRRLSIILAGAILGSSFLLIFVADFISSSQDLILAGRAISGLGVGLGVPATAIYVAEVSSPELRGKLSSAPALLLALGVLLGYVFGIFLAWHHLALACSIPGILTIFTMFFMPESPPHLAR